MSLFCVRHVGSIWPASNLAPIALRERGQVRVACFCMTPRCRVLNTMVINVDKSHGCHSILPSGLLLRSLSLLRLLLLLLLGVRLLLLLLPPRPPRPPLTPFGFSFGGGLTKAKSTEMDWSSSLVLWRALIAAFASGWVGYSMSA
jgi:hypothetical protein